jgi:hypothetical protein
MTAPALIFIRTRGGLAPATAYDAEALDGYPPGAQVEVTIRQRRSGKHHRWFFRALSKLVESGAVPFLTVDEFLDALKIASGVTRLRMMVTGEVYVVPGSISYAAKDQAAFKMFTDRAAQVIAENYGIDLAEMMEGENEYSGNICIARRA